MPRPPKTREAKARTQKTRLSQLLGKIESLKREAEAIRQSERADVIERIQEAIRFYGLTATDLDLSHKSSATSSGRRAKVSKASTFARASGAIQFGDDKGNTWSGRGPRPRWFKEALTKGATPESLRAR